MKLKFARAFFRSWYVWLFPVVALVVAVWVMRDFYGQRGPVIQILFDDAAGIQAQKTTVRFRGVTIGTVEDVRVSTDSKDAIVEVLLRKDAAQFAVEGTKFALIVPKVTFQGISGLETLIEGAYIDVTPGPSRDRIATVFKAAPPAQPTTIAAEEASSYRLYAPNVESVNVGDAITYRGLKIGEVTKTGFSSDGRNVNLTIGVEHKYARLIRSNTAFWVKPGIQAKLGLLESEIKVNSMETIVNGAIELATPEPAGPIAKAGDKFYLHSGPPNDYQKWNPDLSLKATRMVSSSE